MSTSPPWPRSRNATTASFAKISESGRGGPIRKCAQLLSCTCTSCDVDICAECVTGQPASAPPRRAPLPKASPAAVRPSAGRGRQGGMLRRPRAVDRARLRAGMWRYACGSGCDYEICASCEVDEAREGVTVIAAGVKRGRPAAPPGEGQGRPERRGGARRGEMEEGGGACDGQGGEAEGPRRRKARRHIL